MIPFQAMVAAEHIAELQREAVERRLLREARAARRQGSTQRPSSIDPRRVLARLAIRLSHGASAAARWLDPPDEAFAGRHLSAQHRA